MIRPMDRDASTAARRVIRVALWRRVELGEVADRKADDPPTAEGLAPPIEPRLSFRFDDGFGLRGGRFHRGVYRDRLPTWQPVIPEHLEGSLGKSANVGPGRALLLKSRPSVGERWHHPARIAT